MLLEMVFEKRVNELKQMETCLPITFWCNKPSHLLVGLCLTRDTKLWNISISIPILFFLIFYKNLKVFSKVTWQLDENITNEAQKVFLCRVSFSWFWAYRSTGSLIRPTDVLLSWVEYRLESHFGIKSHNFKEFKSDFPEADFHVLLHLGEQRDSSTQDDTLPGILAVTSIYTIKLNDNYLNIRANLQNVLILNK